MVNLDKLIEHKESASNFISETDQQEQLTVKNENNNEIISKQSGDKTPFSPKSSTMDCDLSANNNSDNYDQEENQQTDVANLEEADSVLQESNPDNIHQETNIVNSDHSTENNLPLYQAINDKDDKNHLFNGIKKENNLFYFLDLKSSNSSQLKIIFDQLRNLYFEQQLLDCTLVCEDQCIKAHKLILAAVSPYFRAIFNSFNNNGCTNTAVIVQNVPARDMRIIIKILYSVNDYNPLKLSLNRAISLRKSVYRLKIDFINDQLDQCGVPQLSAEITSSLNIENELLNKSWNTRKRKRPYQEENDDQNRLNSSINSSVSDLTEDKQPNNQSSSESADETSSTCSASMKHHKYKHRYLLSNEHLEQNDKLVKCANNIFQTVEQSNDEMLDREEHQIQEDEEFEENMDDSLSHKNSIKSNSPNLQPDANENDSVSTNNENLLNLSQTNKLNNRSNELEEKVIDFSLTKHANSQDEMIKLVNSAMNNVDNTDKVANLYKAMRSEMNKLWTSNNELNSNDNFSTQLNNQLNNSLLNSTFSQLCMASANLNPETARALLFTNELFKNNTVNNNQLHHPINKNSADNSLNTSTSSTNSSIGNGTIQQQQSNSSAAALVAAQQQLLNAGFLTSSSSTSVTKQSSLNGVLMNNSKTKTSSTNSYSLPNGSSSSSSSYGTSLNSSNGPVKRGRGRPPRHTQPIGSEINSTSSDSLLNKISSSQTVKPPFSSSMGSALNSISNSLSGLNSSTASSIVDSLNAFNNSQNKKWRPNLENLLALKIRKNKLNSNSTSQKTGSPTNDQTNMTSSSSIHNSQANLLTNGGSSKSATSNSASVLNHYSQSVNTSSIGNSNTTSSNSSTSNLNGGGSSNNSANNNSSDGKQQNMCPYCPQVYYSNQAMNDHINNVHTKTAFKYICEFCSKEFSWKISLTKHLKHAHSELNSTFSTRPISNLGVSNLNNLNNLNGLTSAISNHLGTSSLTNQELLHSFMNRDNESATMLNFSAIGD